MRIVMHGHHNTLFSFYDDAAAAAARIAFIESDKPKVQRALRLALLKDVTELLPRTKARTAYTEAWAAYEKARAARKKARAAYEKACTPSEKARTAYEKAWAAYRKSFDVDAFHREHCHPHCPWNGSTIFANGAGVGQLRGA